MAKQENPGPYLALDQLPDLREKTETVSQLLLERLKQHLATLRPLLAPRRALGSYVRSSVREDVLDADLAVKRLREKYAAVCEKPFALPREVDDSSLANIDGRVELYPWEYDREVKNEKESKTVTLVSPVKWILTYRSGLTPTQVRQAIVGKGERRQDEVRQFIINALAIEVVLNKFPGIALLLKELRYEVAVDKCPGLGDLQVVSIKSSLPSFAPSDDIILSATRLSGVPVFVELIDFNVLESWSDPLLAIIRGKPV